MYNSGNKKGKAFKVFAVCVIFSFALSFVFPRDSLAYRSRDGGGDLVEFDFGKWAAGTAIGLVSSAIGGAIAQGIGGALSPNSTFGTGFMNSISSLSTINSWGTNFINSTAVGQVQNAIGVAGSYYGWDPRSTLLISSIAGGVVGGGLSPGHYGSSFGSGLGVAQTLNGSIAGTISAFEGMGIGLLEGSVEGAILMSGADKEGNVDPLTRSLANLTGSLVTGGLVGGLSSSSDGFSFSNIGSFDLSRVTQGLQGAAITTLRSVPSALINYGVLSITKNMVDKQDAYIIKNAFSGLYYVVNTPTNYAVDKAMSSMFANQQTNNQDISNLQSQFRSLPSYPAAKNYDQTFKDSYKNNLKQ
ncbi:MAG: hypothetical protein PHT50_02465 [Candidatus Omnitrophica bacterium]|nr:hypothetical protein [Candidatus Omnitrophota bacterium]